MNRPPEYENLIKTRALEPVEPTEGAVAGYLSNAQDYLDVATSLDAALAQSRADIEAGRFAKGSVAEHLARIDNLNRSAKKASQVK